MSYVFRVGDRGCTKGGQNYEIVKTDLDGSLPLLAVTRDAAGHIVWIGALYSDGKKYKHHEDNLDLIPPGPPNDEPWRADFVFRKGDCGKTRRGDEYEVLKDGMPGYLTLAVLTRSSSVANHWEVTKYDERGWFIGPASPCAADLMKPCGHEEPEAEEERTDPRAKTEHQQRVEEFMRLAGQEVPDRPTIPSEEVRLRG